MFKKRVKRGGISRRRETWSQFFSVFEDGRNLKKGGTARFLELVYKKPK